MKKVSSRKTLPCGRPVPMEPPRAASADQARLQKKMADFVRLRNLNRSASRDAILDVLFQFKTHFPVGHLVREVQRRHPRIGAATVYRNMPIFIEAGLLRESFNDTGRQPYYELDWEGHHDHIVCLDCNAVFEFHETAIESSQDRVISKLNFIPASHQHVIYAHCKLLTRKGTQNHSTGVNHEVHLKRRPKANP